MVNNIMIPHDGVASLCLYTANKEKIAIGYNRIVFGQHGTYIEFTKEQVIKDAMHIAKDKSWMLLKKYVGKIDYIEMRTNMDGVKVYFQRKIVHYADYKPGFIYISPVDLYNETGDAIIKTNKCNILIGDKPLRKKAQVNSKLDKEKKVKILKKDRDFAYDKAHDYLIKRFNDCSKVMKSDIIHYNGSDTLLGTNIKQGDTLLTACIIHTNNLESKDSYITVHFKYIALRELDDVCKKYYLVKERREPVLVELEYMFKNISKNKIIEEYE